MVYLWPERPCLQDHIAIERRDVCFGVHLFLWVGQPSRIHYFMQLALHTSHRSDAEVAR